MPDALEAVEAVAAWLDREAMLRQPIRTLAKSARALFLAQEKAFAREWTAIQERKPALEAAGAQPSDLELAIDLAIEETQDMLLEPYAVQGGVAVTRGGRAVLSQLNLSAELSFALDQQRTIAYVASRGARLVTQVSDSTRRRMRLAILSQLEAGRGVQDIARHIRTHFRSMRTPKPQRHIKDRAHLIAVTELGEAFEAGGSHAAADLAAGGIAIEKEWITAGDEHVSDGCLANAAAGWIPENQEFPSGHAHPLRFAGCRCATGRRVARENRQQ